MGGISHNTLLHLREVFSNCKEFFGSSSRLDSIFVDSRIYPWRNEISFDGTLEDRVNQVINYLHNKFNVNCRRNALVLLVTVLAELIPPQDSRCNQLLQIATELDEQFPYQETAITNMPASTIPFTNREEEIRMLLSPNAPPYAIVDAPAGYGKTELLQRLASEFKSRNWHCAYVKVSSNELDELSEVVNELVNTLVDVLGVTFFKRSRSVRYRLGSALNSHWQGLINGQRDSADGSHDQKLPEGIVLLIDFDERPNLSLFQKVVNELIPATEESLRTLKVFSEPCKFRVILAGRYLAAQSEASTDEIKLSEPYRLAPFSFKVISNSAIQYLPGFSRQDIVELAAYAFYMTGGHPACIADVLRKYKDAALPLGQFAVDYRNDIEESVSTVVDHILKELPEKFSYLYQRDILKHLSIFRLFDIEILEGICSEERNKASINARGLENDLIYTYLFTRHRGVIRDDIIRRMIAIQWRNTLPEEFAEDCRKAQTICLHRIQTDQRRPEDWAIEYLFQTLQQRVHECDSLESRQAMTVDFFKKAVPMILKQLKQVKALKFFDDALQPTLLKDYDWEFQFIVNYCLRESHYDDKPYRRLLAQVRKEVSDGATDPIH